MRLQQHVAELGVADAVVAFHPGTHAILGHHGVDGKVLSDVAQKIEERDGGRPRIIVDQASGVAGTLEVEEAAELTLDAVDVVGELLAREQIALGGFARRIADHAGRATCQRDGVVTGELKPAEHELAHEMADVQAFPSRVEAAIQRDRALGEALIQRREVGTVGDEAAPLEIFEEVHGQKGQRCGGPRALSQRRRRMRFPAKRFAGGRQAAEPDATANTGSRPACSRSISSSIISACIRFQYFCPCGSSVLFGKVTLVILRAHRTILDDADSTLLRRSSLESPGIWHFSQRLDMFSTTAWI